MSRNKDFKSNISYKMKNGNRYSMYSAAKVRIRKNNTKQKANFLIFLY